MAKQLNTALARLNSGTLISVLKGTYKGESRRLHDGGGLYLVPGPHGGGSWVLRYQRNGKPAEAGLGSLSQVGAAEARAMRATMVAAQNPKGALRGAKHKAQAKQLTFREAAEPVIVHYENGPFHPCTKAWWRSISERLIFPAIGDFTVDEIGRAEVLGILRPLWPVNPTAGERARAIIEAVIEEAKVMGHSDEDRANPALKRALSKNLKRYTSARETRNHPSLPWQEVPALMAKLYTPPLHPIRKADTPSVSALALMMTILSGVRAGESNRARWAEFADDEAWRIPAERMKGKVGQRRKHDVPISDGMRLVLNTLRPHRGASPFVFPSYAKAQAVTPGSMLSQLYGHGLRGRTNVHGMRASFRTFAQDHGFADPVGEAALAHYKGGVEGRYARSPLFKERVPLMKAWSDHCLSAITKSRHLSVAS